MKNGIKQGYVRDDLNVKVAAFLVEESTFTYAFANQRKRPKFSYHELFYTMMINFLRGISTTKGIEIIDDYLAKKGTKPISNGTDERTQLEIIWKMGIGRALLLGFSGTPTAYGTPTALAFSNRPSADGFTKRVYRPRADGR